jgi:hypothetical protein
MLLLNSPAPALRVPSRITAEVADGAAYDKPPAPAAPPVAAATPAATLVRKTPPATPKPAVSPAASPITPAPAANAGLVKPDFVAAEAPVGEGAQPPQPPAKPTTPASIGAAAGPTIVGDTLGKPAPADGGTADPTALGAVSPGAAGTLTEASAAEAARNLAPMLTDGGPGGASPPGTSGTVRTCCLVW